jgi:hypothetical protein
MRRASTVSNAPTAAPATPQGSPARHPTTSGPGIWAPQL